MSKKAILAVSFGTSHIDTKEATIDAIEERIKKQFPDHPFYSAWTSGRIIKKLKERDGIRIDTVKEAMEKMLSDGITEVAVQPTFILNGYENDLMIRSVRKFKHRFESIVFSKPLLSSQEDMDAFIGLMKAKFSDLCADEALVLMGHGTGHYANMAYAALDYAFKDHGMKNVFVGCIEAYPGIENIQKLLKEYAPKKVYLTPLLIVAGDHAKNDMAGEDEDSWSSILKRDGYDVECVIKGLGEYEEFRERFVMHLSEVL